MKSGHRTPCDVEWTHQREYDMGRLGATTCLTLLVLIATPVVVPAWERGKVERFATLPSGELTSIRTMMG